MATATSNLKVTPETPVKRGFGSDLPCLHCADSGSVTIYLSDLETCYCTACGEEFSLDEVRDFVGRWGQVLRWLQQAPVAE